MSVGANTTARKFGAPTKNAVSKTLTARIRYQLTKTKADSGLLYLTIKTIQIIGMIKPKTPIAESITMRSKS